jgi:isoleucyl-tRNA synthetase
MSAAKPVTSPDGAGARPYPAVDPSPSFPELEERVLATWQAQGTFARSVEARAPGARGANEFVFYDGPPFANGLPHYGHLLTGFVKDVVPRFQTMRGRRVERRFGWDCHGLPAEMEAEKELGVHGRQAILALGIDRFNAHCRTSVQRYTEDWRRFVERQGRWVDFDRDYKTMDLSFMESVMWAFKRLYDKGLVYESYRVMPYSWAAETPLSNFETRLDDSYRPRQDPAITVAFALDPAPGDPGPLKVLVWTTTPWTLPSNLALAVGPEIEYALIRKAGEVYAIGAAAAAKYERELGGTAGAPPERIGTLRGAELVGRRYAPLFPYFAARRAAGAFRVLGGDFVDTEEGTGVVHMAPGFGEDDQVLCQANGIEIVCPVDDRGRFTAEVSDYAGLLVFDANKPIIQRLKQEGKLVRHETYEHNYPHCWRTDEPLIYRAITSWYVKVTDFRDRMIELNRAIDWYPAHVKDGQFGRWLEGARDWSISRNRFWGSPIPIWRSDDPAYPRLDVYGSLDELERDFGVRPTDLHRPTIDALVRPNPDDPTGKSTMRRVPDVLDCWFESGSMFYAQVHYPFENKEWFEDHFPADFITEYVAQTRGWFYTMHVLATALFDRPPFQNCLCHGIVVDEDGKKLSKRKKNYPSPDEVYDSHGADALRWFLCSSQVMRGGDIAIDRKGKGIGENVRLVLLPIWSAYTFFTLYANADGIRGRYRGEGYENVLDRYVLAKTRSMVESVTTALEGYDLPAACAAIRGLIDALNNWFIRRSRPRFWSEEESADKQDAYDALYTVLHTLCRCAAPLLPFVTEEIYRGLTGADSVHLADWPDASELPADAVLVRDMDRVREVCSVGLALREEHRLRTRLPLQSLVVAGGPQLDDYRDLIRDEVNVRSFTSVVDFNAFASRDLRLNARVLGPRVGTEMKRYLAAAKGRQWDRVDGVVTVLDRRLEPDEYTITLTAHEDLEGYAVAALPDKDAVVALDVRTTPELEREGLARDLVRQVQQARKAAGLHVSDRIRLFVDGPEPIRAAAEAHGDMIAEQTLANEIVLGQGPPDAFRQSANVDDHDVRISVVRA